LTASHSIIGHVGDSWIYRWCNGHLSCLTRDHTFAEEEKMNQQQILLGLFVAIGLMLGVPGCQLDPNSPEGILKNVDAKQAVAIANEWMWSRKDIKSHVTSRDVVFELPKDKVIRIPLPDDQMMIAVAPYIKQTHD
jgi:hypothetical protein